MLRPSIKFITKNPDQKLFFATLRQKVDRYFKENKISKHYNSTIVVKTVVLLSAYILPFIALLAFQPGLGIGLLLWAVMGLAQAGIGMSIMHDANHGAYAKSSAANFWLGHTINLVGGAVFNWKLQHNKLHHTYTNVTHMDDDIDGKHVMRFSPNVAVKWHYRLQYIYAFFLYGLSTLYWVSVKDFVQFAQYIKDGVNKNDKRTNTITLAKIIFGKICYFGVMLFLPIFVFNIPFMYVLTGFFLMLFVSGIVLSVIFQLAHTIEETAHPMPMEDNTIENCWAIHQLNTTANFSRSNKVLSWYIGGLNFQVEHHLFPQICHVHYPKIAPIVKQTAEEFGIPYLEHKTFWKAFRSHVRVLRKFGKLPSMDEVFG